MSVANQCFSQFTANTRSAGHKYFDRDDVELESRDEETLLLVVYENSGLRRRVMIGWADRLRQVLTCDCSCSGAKSLKPCKHVWACFLYMDDRALELPGQDSDDEPPHGDQDDDGWAGVGDWTVDGREHLDWDESLDATRPFASDRRLPRGRNGRRTASDWKRILDETSEQLKGNAAPPSERILPGAKIRRGWYVIDVRATYDEGELVLDLFQQESLKNGGFGKIKTLRFPSGSNDHFSDPRENRLMQRLQKFCAANRPSGYRSYYHSPYSTTMVSERVRMDSLLFDALLPDLAATGRLGWYLDSSLPVEEAGTVSFDDGEPWRFRPQIKTYFKERQWRITGRLCRGDEDVSLDDPVLLLSSGLVLFPERLGRCEAGEVFSWIRLLRQQSQVTISFDEKEELLKRLWTLPHADQLSLPRNLQWPVSRPAPRGFLRVHAPRNRFHSPDLTASVFFQYDGQLFPANDAEPATVDGHGRRVLVRDAEQETRLWEMLRDAGVRSSAEMRESGQVCVPRRELSAVVKHLLTADWEVEAEGQKLRRPGECTMNVRSTLDWFELDAEFDFDGATADLPDLLKAIQKGDQFVKLSDGSRGLLPEAWLERYGALADLATEENGALRFRPSQAALLDALLAAQEDQTRVQVDQTFAELCGKLRSFEGIETCPPPSDFQGTLRDYQATGLSWLNFLREFRLGGCLADDMGLGKTVQVLALLQHCRGEDDGRHASEPGDATPSGKLSSEQKSLGEKSFGEESSAMGPSAGDPPAHRPSLVVAPRSLIFNWIEEASRFAPNLKVLNYTGLDRQRLIEQFSDYDVIITTYGTLRRDVLRFKDLRFRYAILDESQAIKNAGSQAAKACRLLIADHRLAMTGTPVENHLGELWSLFEFLNPGLLGTSAAFQRLFQSSSAENPESLRVLSRALSPFILRRTKQEVLKELPEKTEQTLHCEMPPHQRQQYEELRDYYRGHLTEQIEKKGFQKAKIHVLEALLRLRQAACHPGLVDSTQIHKSSAKLDTLLSQLERVRDEGHKALVFSQFTSLLSIVRDRLDKRRLRYTYLDGRTRKRQDRVREFQEDPDCGLFLISLKAGGFGLNLTAAEYVFILDPWWNPAVEAQAVDRAHRIGQTQPVFAYRLICQDTVEQRILELQQSKRDLAEAIVSANNNVVSQLTAEDLQALLS